MQALDPVQAVNNMLARAATASERIISGGRVVLLGLALGRAAWVWSHEGRELAVWHEVSVLLRVVAVLGFGVYLFFATRSRPVRRGELLVSIALDSVVSFAALLGNTIDPVPDHMGLLQTPDLSILMIATLVSGVRLLPSGAVLAGLLNLSALGALVAIDLSLHEHLELDRMLKHLTFHVFLQIASMACALLMCVWTRQLVRAGAQTALRADAAARNLDLILRDHHDVRSHMSAAMIHTELLIRKLQQAGREGALSNLADDVKRDLATLGRSVSAIKERSYEALLEMEEPSAVDVARSTEAAIKRFRALWRTVEFKLQPPASRCVAWIAGGDTAFERVLLNLLTNAVEGDGRTGATSIAIELSCEPDAGDRRGERVRVRIEDDGPGFPLSALAVGADERFTSKRAGSGLGLILVAALIRAGGGRLTRGNRGGGGAYVELDLAAAGEDAALLSSSTRTASRRAPSMG